MSALWVNFYLKTTVSTELLWENLIELIKAHITKPITDQTVFADSGSAVATQEQYMTNTVLVYPGFRELFSVDIRGFFASSDFVDKDPAWGMPYVTDDSIWKQWERVTMALSQRLNAEVVFVAFQRNPVVEETIILFYADGQQVDEYYHVSGENCYLIQPQNPALISQRFNGRFDFLNELPYYPEDPDTPRRAFVAPESIYEATEQFFHVQANQWSHDWKPYRPEWFVYQPDKYQLFLPFNQPGLSPYGIITFEGASSLT